MREIKTGGGTITLPADAKLPEDFPNQPKHSKITKRCFLDRLLPQEEIDIDLASIGDTQQAASVRRFMRRIEMSPFVDLSLQQTIDGVHMMEQLDLISQGRAAEILTNPIQDFERWNG